MISQLPTTIYCDEAGYSGNNLFDEQQPHFVYSSVAVDPHEADEVVNQTIKDFRLQLDELKGSKLLRTQRGKAAAIHILENYVDYSKVFVCEKRYTLAAKFFEYIFEPVLASKSSIFYGIRFHRFISNLIYLHFLAQDSFSEKLLLDFQETFRSQEFERFEEILQIGATDRDISEYLRGILTFAECHKKAILAELRFLREEEATKNYVLELSITALFSLLASWGEDIQGMEVYCDDSQPIVTQADYLDAMIGREDRVYYHIGGRQQPLTFNLAQPIQVVNSKLFPGVQIADVVASSIAFVYKNPTDDFSGHCAEICDNVLHPNSIFPELEFADLSRPEGFINAQVFHVLMDRTLRGQDLLDGIEGEISEIVELYPLWLAEQSG